MANKQDLTDLVAKKLNLRSKTQGVVAVDAVTDALKELLEQDGSVQLAGFGAFRVTKRSARVGINPQTREPVDIPAKKTIGFRAGKALKTAMNKKKGKK